MTTPIICRPDAIPENERAAHGALTRALFSQQRGETRPLADGFRLTFEPDLFDSIVKYVKNERLCCPFIAFRIVVAADSGPITLELTGPIGTKELIGEVLRMV